VIVAVGAHGGAEDVGVAVNGPDGGDEEDEELDVVLGCLPGIEEVVPLVVRQGPVQVLAGTVDPREGLFMEEAGQLVLLGHRYHGVHGDLVVIDG